MADPVTSLILVTAWPGQPSVEERMNAAARGERPRTDYVEIARRLGGTVVDGDYLTHRARGGASVLSGRGRMDLAQVWTAVSRRRDVEHVVAWGDRLGLMLASVWKAARIKTDLTVVSVLLSTPRKARFIRATGAMSGARLIVQYSSQQREVAIRDLRIPPSRLAHLLQPVDLSFWSPNLGSVDGGLICAVGTEARDYGTLVEAVRDLDVRLEIAIGTMVRTPGEGGDGSLPPTMAGLPREIPANVQFRHHLTPVELRELYRRAQLVVVPLRDVDYDAGVTAITEAMAMGKPVVVTRTRGQVDIVTHGQEGLFVPPGDVRALRSAIASLVDDAAACTEMGLAGRRLAEAQHSLDDYADDFTGLVRAG